MAVQTTERVHVMMENFMELHEQGYSIPEIAEKFNLNSSTIYRHLQEIADANGVLREDLLQIVKVSFSRKHWNEQSKREKATFEILEQGLNSIEIEVDKLIRALEEELTACK